MHFFHKTKQDLDVTIVSLHGELIDRNQGKALLGEIDTMVANRQLKYVFDLKDLKYINSSGLSVLINILTKVRTLGGEVIISTVSAKVNELLIITKLHTIFTVTDSIEKAIAKLK